MAENWSKEGPDEGGTPPSYGNEALELLEELLKIAPRDNQRLMTYLTHLKRQLQMDGEDREKARQALAEFEEAYEKLTSPANRICTYLGDKEDLAYIASGDTEFIANLDPKGELDNIKPGAKVRVNDAYTILEDLGAHLGGQVVKVSEVYDDSRLRVSMDAQGTSGRVVQRGHALKKKKIVVGDEVRMDPTFRLALEHYPHEEVRDYYLEEVPELPWSKVGGQEDAIRLIKDTIEYPLLHPEIYKKFDKKPIKGILLFGPPGCGKTLIGKATAYNLTQEYSKLKGSQVEEYFMYISGPKILNMWLGETERMVREIFTIAREKAKEGRLVFIFIDECESILRTRSSGRWLNISNTVVPQFCAEMDGLVALENVVVMLTSNRPDYIDPAVLRPERIDRKVKIGRPDKAASRDILRIYLHDNIPVTTMAHDEMAEQATEFLWRKAPETQFLTVYLRNGGREVLHWSDLVSGALLKSAVDRAKDYAIRRAIDATNIGPIGPTGQSHKEGRIGRIGRIGPISPMGPAQEPPAGDGPIGVTLEDLTNAIRAEYAENEIFPKTDSQEDWLKLLDTNAEDVASVKSIRDSGKDPLRGQIV